MDGRACSLVRASAVRVCAVPTRGLGMTACLICGAVRPGDTYQGGVRGQNFHWNV